MLFKDMQPQKVSQTEVKQNPGGNVQYLNNHLAAPTPSPGRNQGSDLKYEQNRLSTFYQGVWPLTCPVKPEGLAKAGFYCLSVEDRVRCFFCKVSLGFQLWLSADI